MATPRDKVTTPQALVRLVVSLLKFAFWADAAGVRSSFSNRSRGVGGRFVFQLLLRCGWIPRFRLPLRCGWILRSELFLRCGWILSLAWRLTVPLHLDSDEKSRAALVTSVPGQARHGQL